VHYLNAALNKAHAAISLGASNTYCYDPNGNMVRRTIGTTTYDRTYEAESQLTGVSGGATASFVYEGDGKRVKGTVGGVTTTYIGNYFEWRGKYLPTERYGRQVESFYGRKGEIPASRKIRLTGKVDPGMRSDLSMPSESSIE